MRLERRARAHRQGRLPGASALRQKTILVVDDDELARRSMKAILQHSGFLQILEASNGVHALTLFNALGETIDLIVTDIQMPGMDGVTFVRLVKQELPRIPVIYVSGHTQPKELVESDEYCAFVQKPFLPKTLMDAVRECLEENPNLSVV